MCLNWQKFYIAAMTALAEYKDKIDTLEKVSGFNVDSLIEYFSNGCTLITPEAKKEAESCKYVFEGLMVYEASTTEEEKKKDKECYENFLENNLKAASMAAVVMAEARDREKRKNKKGG